MIQVRVDTDGIRDAIRDLRRLNADIADKATAAALNRTAAKARTEMRRAITDEFDLKASEVNAVLTVSGASARFGELRAVLSALPGSRGKASMNVVRFLRQRVSAAQARSGKQLGFRFKRGAGIKSLNGAFVGNRGRTVFRRSGTKRLPIEPVQVIGVPGMFNARRITARVVRKIEAEFPVEFGRAARAFLGRFA